MADEAVPEEGVELDTPAGEAPDADEGPADPVGALKAFDEKLVDEILKTSPTPKTTEKGAAGAEDVEESPAERNAGAASDDDEESDEEDPIADLRAKIDELQAELKASREGGKGSAAILEAAVSESPEIASIESEMRAAEQEARNTSIRATEIVKLHTEAKESLATKKGELKYAADVDKLDIRDDIRSIERDIRDLEREYSEKVKDTKTAQITQKRLTAQRADEVARIKQALAKRTTDAEADKTAQKEARASYHSALDAGLKEYGLSTKRDGKGKYTDPTVQKIDRRVKADVTLHLRRLEARDPNAPAVNVQELVNRYWQDEVEARGLKVKKDFTRASTERRESRAGATPRGARSATPSPLSRLPKETLQDGKFWMERAARLAGESS